MSEQKQHKNLVKPVKMSSVQKNTSKVIKGDRVHLSNPIRVTTEKAKQSKHQEEALDPIIENNEIIGVVYKCRCGHRARIIFEYKQ